MTHQPQDISIEKSEGSPVNRLTPGNVPAANSVSSSRGQNNMNSHFSELVQILSDKIQSFLENASTTPSKSDVDKQASSRFSGKSYINQKAGDKSIQIGAVGKDVHINSQGE